MSDFWNWIFYSLPWFVQALLLAIPIAIVFYFAVLIFGWQRVRPFVLPVLGGLAALGFATKLKQDGYADRKAEEKDALDKAEEVVTEKRTEIRDLPDDELDRRLDRWEKP